MRQFRVGRFIGRESLDEVHDFLGEEWGFIDPMRCPVEEFSPELWERREFVAVSLSFVFFLLEGMVLFFSFLSLFPRGDLV